MSFSCVHITKQTKDILKDEFVCEPGYGRLRDKYLRDNNVETFFIKPPTPQREQVGYCLQTDVCLCVCCNDFIDALWSLWYDFSNA